MKILMIAAGVVIAVAAAFVALAAWDMSPGEGVDSRMYAGRAIGTTLFVAGIVLVIVGIRYH
jgi:hypothetical protein